MGVLESSDVVLLMLVRKCKKKWILEQNMIEETKTSNWETLMKKAILILSILTLVFLFAIYSAAENRSPKLIAVRPAVTQTSQQPQNSGPAPELYGQYPDPTPRDQLYVFWLFGKIISYPVDKIESYVSKKLYSVEKPQLVPAAASAPGVVSSPFDSINRREIPPAPPVQDKSVHNR